jgi:putative ATPase
VPEIVELLRRALTDEERGLGGRDITATDEALETIAVYASGDARTAYNVLELAATAGNDLTPAMLHDVLGKKMVLYDKAGEEHFNLISALHKSVRSSDVQAALYWLARMLEGGEDRMYLARRLMRMAIEDIGMADPRALEQAVAVKECVHFMGIPEGDQALAQVAIYLCMAPKSDAAYSALNDAMADVRSKPSYTVPFHIRNAPTRSMKEWGYGKGYQHAHQFTEAVPGMECLPDELRGRSYYEPTSRGLEQRVRERMEEIERLRKERQADEPTS